MPKQTEPPSPDPKLPEQDSLATGEDPAAADAAEPEPTQPRHTSWLHRFKAWYLTNKKWTIAATCAVVILILVAIPWSRYHAAGLVLKRNYSINIYDSTSHTPVSGASVTSGGKSVLTDGSGKASLRLPVGAHNFSFSKKYYQSRQISATVPILSQKTIPKIQLVATGRQVNITVTNLINKKALGDVEIAIADVKAKTDKNGQALVAVPANLSKAQATLSLSGYNDATATIKISDQSIESNAVSLTPAGKVYFLSKLSGKIDVVKANLDGTDRTTVIAGTGAEDDSGTVLLASRDWKYLALLARRDSDQAKLYVINTADEKLLTMDEGNANFTPVGWQNHTFIYQVSRLGYQNWQPNANSIKSYNAQTGQLTTLANTNATGSSNADAQYENIWEVKIVGNDIVYTRTWYKYPGYLQVPGQQDVVAAVHADGTDARQLKSVDAATAYFSNLTLVKPTTAYVGLYSSNGTADTSFYQLDKSGNFSQNSSIKDSDLTTEATYLASPSGSQNFWSDERDGKNTLFVGDQDGNNATQIASLSDYNIYGWYSDDYLLVSKNASELYVIPASGIKKDSDAIKITDYHKPSPNFYGYGGL